MPPAIKSTYLEAFQITFLDCRTVCAATSIWSTVCAALKCFNALRMRYCNCRSVVRRDAVWQRKVANLSVLLPGLEAASQGAMHEQLGNSQQLLPHVLLVCCLLSPGLECSEHHAKCQHSPGGMPVTSPNAVAYTLVYLSDTHSNLNTHNGRARSLVNRVPQAHMKHPKCCSKATPS